MLMMIGDIIVTLLLLLFSALFSSLNLAILSLSTQELKRKMELGNKDAALIYPIRVRGNQFMVTLLIVNVMVNATLAVFFTNIMPGLLAIVLATILIILFGEVAPKALFSKQALFLGARFAWVVDKLMLVLSPIAYPLSKLINNRIGSELPSIFTKNELIKIIADHSQSEDSNIDINELRIVKHALMYSDKQIEDIMTPRTAIKSVEREAVLSPKLLNELHESGFSRFPVYDESPDKIVGTLYVHDLIDIRDKAKAKDAMSKKVYFINEKMHLDHVFDAFFKTKHHLFIVVNEFSEVVGLITIEDVIEEILGKEIVDEFDQYEDMRAVALHKATKKKSIILPNQNSS